MEWSIRLATREDEPGIQRSVKAVYDEYGFIWDAHGYHKDLYDIDEHYFSAGDLFWVAELEGEVVATVALTLFPLRAGEFGSIVIEGEDPRVAGADCELNRLYVDPAARRKGIGQALTLTAIEHARSLGRQAMELWSDKQFGDAHRLYGALGAKVVGERDCTYPEVYSEWGLLIDLR